MINVHLQGLVLFKKFINMHFFSPFKLFFSISLFKMGQTYFSRKPISEDVPQNIYSNKSTYCELNILSALLFKHVQFGYTLGGINFTS